jgi:hypothetical protein
MRKIGKYWTDGKHRHDKADCKYCGCEFFRRIDKTTRFCSQKCWLLSVERKNTIHLTDYDKEIVEGSLLSDGCVTKSYNAKNYRFVHSSICEEYVDFIKQELSFNTGKQKRFAKDGVVLGKKCSCAAAFQLRTCSSPTFTEYRKRWYNNRKKIVPDDFILTPVNALHWYLGDGHLDNSHGIILCTESFTMQDSLRLIDRLRSVGIRSSMKKKRILIPNKWVFEFLKFIGSCPVRGMLYKWDTIVRSSYFARRCPECRKTFDADMNHHKHCSNLCYQRNWRKPEATQLDASS